MPARNTQVDDFINALPEWQKQLCSHVRELIHQAEPEIEETIKRTDQPNFVLSGNVCALQATKDHINIFIYDPIAPDPQRIINQGHDNQTARSIQLYEPDVLDESAFRELISAVVTNNRAGGWRTLKKQ